MMIYPILIPSMMPLSYNTADVPVTSEGGEICSGFATSTPSMDVPFISMMSIDTINPNQNITESIS
jgi:hypothetical protein